MSPAEGSQSIDAVEVMTPQDDWVDASFEDLLPDTTVQPAQTASCMPAQPAWPSSSNITTSATQHPGSAAAMPGPSLLSAERLRKYF